MTTIRMLPILLLLCSPLSALAGKDRITALDRSNGVNFKDMALASCIAQAYKGSAAGKDAVDTSATYLEWTYYDVDKGNHAIDQLVDKYLRRDYSTPVEGYADAKFDLLKCLDMYHSPELDEQVLKYVPHPDWVGDKPPKHKK
jgi:Type VI secretion system (T6SS), amidase immunity protein